MANPLQGVTQVAIQDFYGLLQRLENLAKPLKADMDADKLTLTRLYTATRTDTDAARRAKNQAMLSPIIHQNSVLRQKYAELVGAFNDAANKAADQLRSAGYDVPNLSGLGIAPIIIVGAAVAVLGGAFALYEWGRSSQDVNRTKVNTAAHIIQNPSDYTPAQVDAAVKLITDPKSTTPPPPDPLGLTGLLQAALPIALIGAAIYLLPMFMRRRAA